MYSERHLRRINLFYHFKSTVFLSLEVKFNDEVTSDSYSHTVGEKEF